MQYGVFTRMKRACNAAIPLASTVPFILCFHVGLKRSGHILENDMFFDTLKASTVIFG